MTHRYRPLVAEELLKWVSTLGIPKEIITDPGSKFMSHIMHSLLQVLKIQHLRTTVYHLQMNGLVERFNDT